MTALVLRFPEVEMNIQDAAHRIGHEYPGGAVALAHRMGINPTVFNSKLNPNNTTHHLTLVEAQRMQQLTGRTDILEAMASELGYVIMHRPGTVDGCDIPSATRRSMVEFGDWMREVDAALTDGKVTLNEVRAIERELVQMIGQAQLLTACLSEMTGAAK